jgi:hypothetical protein
VLASNAALYVTSGDDTGDDASFGASLQDDANDGGGLSLREALYWAGQTPGVDRIVFQTDVTLASSIITPTETMLIDGQSFTLNGGGYSGFQITTSSMTFAIQNLKFTHFTTDDNQYSGGLLGSITTPQMLTLRLYNVEISGNRDDLFGNGMIDLFNLSPAPTISTWTGSIFMTTYCLVARMTKGSSNSCHQDIADAVSVANELIHQQ